MGNTIVNSLVFAPRRSGGRPVASPKTRRIASSNGEYCIPYRLYGRPSSTAVIYSHGNAEDLAQIDAWCTELAKKLQVQVYAYDYCGYGAHRLWGDGTSPTEANVLSDIADVIQRALDDGYLYEQMVLYGRSLGSAPSIWAAAEYDARGLGGLIVESGFRSVVTTISQTRLLRLFDMFRDEDRIQFIHRVPVLFVHGRQDTVVPFSHGVRLYTLCRSKKYHEWIENGTHNNLDGTYKDLVLSRVAWFLEGRRALSRSRPLTWTGTQTRVVSGPR